MNKQLTSTTLNKLLIGIMNSFTTNRKGQPEFHHRLVDYQIPSLKPIHD